MPHYQPEGETFLVGFRLAGSIAAGVLEEYRQLRENEEQKKIRGGPNQVGQKLLRFQSLKYIGKLESMLHTGAHGPHWLNRPEIAAIVDEAIRFRDGNAYDLIAHTIMPNHVHMIVTNVGRPDVTAEDDRKKSDLVGRTDCPKEEHLSVGSPTRHTSGRDSVPSDKEDARLTRHYLLTDVVGSLKKYTALRANRLLGRTGPFWQPESYDHVIRNGQELYRTLWYVLNNPVKARLCKDWHDWKWTYIKSGCIGD